MSNMNKPIPVIAGLLALVAVSYFGLGLSSRDNSAQAQNDVAAKWSTGEVDLSTDKAKLGYTFGARIGTDLAQGGMAEEVDVQALAAGIRDAMLGSELKLTNEEMAAAQQTFQLKQQQEFAALAADNLAKGEDFMAKSKSDEGVKETESGLQYQVVREGKGAQPAAKNVVRVHYIGTLIDGTPFDSSYSRNEPADFPVGAVIPGFAEGLQLMKEGAKYRFVIPSSLAYGEQGPPSIGPNQVLIFEVELLEILPPPGSGAGKSDG